VISTSLHTDTGGDVLSPAPLARGMPPLYLEPDLRAGGADASFVTRFTEALDAVLAPVFCTLDNLPAYFDPRTAPVHFLDWLAGWVGLELYEKWTTELRRTLIAGAVQLHRERGTSLGLERVVAIFAEVDTEEVTIQESGGTWGRSGLVLDDGRYPEVPPPVGAGPWLKVEVAIGAKRHADDGEVERVTAVVRRVATRVKPAHVALLDVVVSP
jgi:phage tail-like protein